MKRFVLIVLPFVFLALFGLLGVSVHLYEFSWWRTHYRHPVSFIWVFGNLFILSMAVAFAVLIYRSLLRRFQSWVDGPPLAGARWLGVLSLVGLVLLWLTASKAIWGWKAVRWIGALGLTFVGYYMSWTELYGGGRHRKRFRILLLVGGVSVVVSLTVAYLATLSRPFAAKLQSYTLSFSASILSGLGLPIEFRPEASLLKLSWFSAVVHKACAGQEGMGYVFAFLFCYFLIEHQKFKLWRVFGLTLAATLFSWVMNSVRIAVFMALGHWFTPLIAERAFHTQAGILFIVFICLGTALIARSSSFFVKERFPSLIESREFAFVLPMFSFVVVHIMTGGFKYPNSNYFYPLAFVVPCVVSYFFRSQYRLTLEYLWSGGFAGVVAFGVWGFIGLGQGEPGILFSGIFEQFSIGLAGVWVFVRFLGYVVLAPWIEELFFRSYLIDTFQSWLGTRFKRPGWGAVLLSAVLFAALHSHTLAAFVVGAIYGWVYLTRGLSAVLMSHLVTNLLVLIYTVMSGDISLWG